MFGKWPTRIFVSAKTELDTKVAIKIDNHKIDIFIGETVAVALRATRPKSETAERFQRAML